MRKNIVIIILLVLIAGLSVKLYRAKQFSDAFVKVVIPTIKKQNDACVDLSAQVEWLKGVLNHTIRAWESERGWEPLPIKTLDGEESHMFITKSGEPIPMFPVAWPYKKPPDYAYDLGYGVYKDVSDLEDLSAFMEYTAIHAQSLAGRMEYYFENFQERLKRFEPTMKED